MLLPLEARERGFRNALAFRRFCKREGVTIHRRGRLELVCPADLDRLATGPAAARPPAHATPAAPTNAAVDHAVAVLTGGKV